MWNLLRRRNEALPGLVISILLYGVLVWLAGIWFVSDKTGYSVGLWYGIAIAVGQAVHIATVIYDSVTMTEGKRTGRIIIAKSVLRYLVVAALVLLFGYFGLGNLFALFLGVFGLKISAYFQPVIDKILYKIRR